MGLAKIELQNAAKKRGCLGKSADDEPIFTLCARDVAAPAVVERWIEEVERLCYAVGIEPPEKKIAEARALAHQMRAWQTVNGAKLPD